MWVCFEIGWFVVIEFEVFYFVFDVVMWNFVVEGVEFIVIDLFGWVFCYDCMEEKMIEYCLDFCFSCGGGKMMLQGGDEMWIKDLEVV